MMILSSLLTYYFQHTKYLEYSFKISNWLQDTPDVY